ncbi:MAG: hypothetical protein AUJ85_00555 [Elusimicrobia bacterium CG1_02_37_114]|nr:MAG: hypothetical protein AUJ85_00555 [Elusimicrobia bacterium CG1_02_37_114]PIV52466.1 MAG: hypothetical protein COS17_09010 [Elusimicrobia bacterium CG02_land_8_20_14_3_00_37_13]PIZ14340.1 MAG: hypothetical protein COY53_00505 [Elusimicrobia bacterium CG_4_10_14_0_8_um_filter_37_32]
MTTIQEAIKVIRVNKISIPEKKKGLARQLLGKFKGIIPESKTGCEFIREIRNSLHGKVK